MAVTEVKDAQVANADAMSRNTPHSVPEEAISIEVNDEKFVSPPSFQPIREVGPHLPDDCESPLELCSATCTSTSASNSPTSASSRPIRH